MTDSISLCLSDIPEVPAFTCPLYHSFLHSFDDYTRRRPRDINLIRIHCFGSNQPPATTKAKTIKGEATAELNQFLTKRGRSFVRLAIYQMIFKFISHTEQWPHWYHGNGKDIVPERERDSRNPKPTWPKNSPPTIRPGTDNSNSTTATIPPKTDVFH